MGKKGNGFAGRMLRINLTKNEIKQEDLDHNALRKFPGGVSYAAKVLVKELEPGVDPLSPSNKLMIATGPLTGTLCPGSGSLEVCFKSPLTGVWGESRMGGGWGPELKYAGFDMLVLEGKTERLSYVWVHDGEVEIKSAEHLRNETIPNTERLLREEIGEPRAKVMAIGPAGEKLVRFASILSNHRAAGRCGGGAVLGSKNVKAIAVRGHKGVSVAHPEKFFASVRKAENTVMSNPSREAFSIGGTIGDLPGCDLAGDLPTKYGISNSWGKGESIYTRFRKNNLVNTKACTGCIIDCGRYVGVETGRWRTPLHGGAEYESMVAFTAFMLNEDVDAAVHATYLCNIYGMDTISCGNAIAFAMECHEQGLLTKKDMDGINLSWNNPEAIITMVDKIQKREGFGKILGEGVRKAAEEIGGRAPSFALHVKGLEMPFHDPRSGNSLILTYGTANRGMCHIHPFETFQVDGFKSDFGLIPYGLANPKKLNAHEEKGKGKLVKLLQDFGVLFDILGTCKFLTYCGLDLKIYSELLSGLTGWDVDELELLKTGERAINLQRYFNCREGIRRKDDMVPRRICNLPAFGDYSANREVKIENYDKMLDEYYDSRGWDRKTGIPSKEKLKELDLDEITGAIHAQS